VVLGFEKKYQISLQSCLKTSTKDQVSLQPAALNLSCNGGKRDGIVIGGYGPQNSQLVKAHIKSVLVIVFISQYTHYSPYCAF